MVTNQFIESFLLGLEGSKGSKAKKQTPGAARRSLPAPKWIPPPTGSCKVNVDGAVAKTANRRAVGAVCQSCDGTYMGASVVVF